MVGMVPMTTGYGVSVVKAALVPSWVSQLNTIQRNHPKPRPTGRFFVRGSQPRAERQSEGYWVMFRGMDLFPRLVADWTSVAGSSQQMRTGFLKDRSVVVAPRGVTMDVWHT